MIMVSCIGIYGSCVHTIPALWAAHMMDYDGWKMDDGEIRFII